MDTTTLGRTGLRVSVAGLGGGGHSRLGMATGRTEDESVAVVHRALELGITFIDTAEAYGTEPIVGRGIAGRRDDVVLSTKAWIRGRDGQMRDAARLVHALDGSLSRLGTDHVDVWHLHGVPDALYDRAVEEFLPAMHKARDEGKVRFLGITEVFGQDTGHRMLERALGRAGTNDLFDVVMVGFNLLNQSARDRVFASTLRSGVATLVMFAVRHALADPQRARAVASRLGVGGDPIGLALEHASSLTDAAYRFCRHEPGVDVVLTGTGDVAHLEQNVASLLLPPLPPVVAEQLRAAFAGIDSLSGNENA